MSLMPCFREPGSSLLSLSLRWVQLQSYPALPSCHQEQDRLQGQTCSPFRTEASQRAESGSGALLPCCMPPAHAQPVLLWCLCGSNWQLSKPALWRRTEARTFLPKGFVDEENTMTGLVDQENNVFKLAGGVPCCFAKQARLSVLLSAGRPE